MSGSEWWDFRWFLFLYFLILPSFFFFYNVQGLPLYWWDGDGLKGKEGPSCSTPDPSKKHLSVHLILYTALGQTSEASLNNTKSRCYLRVSKKLMNNIKDMYLQKLTNLISAISTMVGSNMFECSDSAHGLSNKAT